MTSTLPPVEAPSFRQTVTDCSRTADTHPAFAWIDDDTLVAVVALDRTRHDAAWRRAYDVVRETDGCTVLPESPSNYAQMKAVSNASRASFHIATGRVAEARVAPAAKPVASLIVLDRLVVVARGECALKIAAVLAGEVRP